jgi:ferredoxin-thioredoxin reductase catalytic subunit
MGSAVGSSCGAKCPSRLPTGKNETDPSMSCILLHFSGTWADDHKCKCGRRLERVALQVRVGGRARGEGESRVVRSEERVVSSG